MTKAEYRKMVEQFRRECARNALAEPGVHSFVVVLDHLKASFNVAKIFRSADAFGAREVHLVGIAPFATAPARGSFRKVPARFHDNIAPALTDLEARGYSLIAFDPVAERTLDEIELPEKSAFLFGHEEFGFTFDPQGYPSLVSVRIPQYGAVQSLNVSVAASIAMYEYVRQWSPRAGIRPAPPQTTLPRMNTKRFSDS